MKKIISLFLALLMAFSFVTVSFAEETTAPETTAPAEGGALGDLDLGEYDWILDLPFWTVGPALKFAKIAFKLVSAYLKVAKIFGLVDQDMTDMLLGAITDMIKNSQNGGSTEVPEETTTAPDTSAVAA
ncbi:MAG: hypothetical protein IJ349_11395 [Clostridia bacterium]|nr:hypothetical protein [Clostridia bacterium]